MLLFVRVGETALSLDFGSGELGGERSMWLTFARDDEFL